MAGCDVAIGEVDFNFSTTGSSCMANPFEYQYDIRCSYSVPTQSYQVYKIKYEELA